MDGVVVVDKPEGWTSFDIVAKVRRLFQEKKVGHTGTLDPLATGVLVVLLGKAAKAQVFMEDSYKEYVAEFMLGISTDTQDITGNVTKKVDVKVCSRDIQLSIQKFIGDIKQIPPMYSALKRNGVKLYEMARKGIEVEREARKITIYEIELLDYDEQLNKVKIRVRCSKGTYIRTLCADIGVDLGCGAVMTSLRRTYTNGFSILDSKTIDELSTLADSRKLDNIVLNTEVLFKNLPSVFITEAQKVRFLNGGSLMLSRVNLDSCDNGQVKVYYQEDFLGLGEVNVNKNEISVLKVLSGVNKS